MKTHASPHVLVVGGYLTEPVNYHSFRQRLLRQGAARVSQAPIHLPDWALVTFAGMGPLLLRGGRAIREARGAAPAPLIVIGHSMGGLIARLAMAPQPLDGRVAAVSDDVGCLVTLGTPHRFKPSIPWRHAAVRAVDHLDAVSPGAWFTPTTRYLTVGSTLTKPADRGPVRSVPQAANRVLFGFVGHTPGSRGDGLVGDDLTQLDGARHLSYPDVRHGTLGAPWYGNDEVVDRWWPIALEEWRMAIEARETIRARAETPPAERTHDLPGQPGQADQSSGRIVASRVSRASSPNAPRLARWTTPSASTKNEVGIAKPR